MEKYGNLPCSAASMQKIPQKHLWNLFFPTREKLIRCVGVRNIWLRKRGTGLTLRKAEAQLIYPDERQPVTKAKDVTAAVEQLLGLSYDQFTQIAMIAQGDFQKLLLAGTVQRGEIFRQIFHTGLYQQIQMRLRDAAISRYKDYDEMRRSIAQYLDGVRFQTDAGTEAEEFFKAQEIEI